MASRIGAGTLVAKLRGSRVDAMYKQHTTAGRRSLYMKDVKSHFIVLTFNY